MSNNDFYDRLRLYFNTSYDAIEKKLELSTGYISKARSGIIKNPDKVIFSLKRLGLNPDYFLTGEGSPELQSAKDANSGIKIYTAGNLPENTFLIPLLDQNVSAGKGSLLPDSDTFKTVIPAPAFLSRYGENLAALYVDGDSMEPTMSRGDMVVCDSCGWSGEGIYTIQIDGCGFVKRLTKKPGKVVIISDNPAYETYEEPSESEAVKIVGRVHCIIRMTE